MTLYFSLREADARGLAKIVANVPAGEGLAEAIKDRLERASVSLKNENLSESSSNTLNEFEH